MQASGFVWGESQDDLPNDITLGGYASGVTSGELSYELNGLSASKTYWYKAYVQVWDSETNTAVPVYGNLRSFTTLPPQSGVANGWLELPAITGSEDYVGKFYGSGGNTGKNRNYSYNYSYDHFGCLWVAYPLTLSHTKGNASTSSWHLNPNVNDSYEIQSVTSGSYTANYNNSTYSKGHQIPNADRKSDDTMNYQTYYVTNQTPQIQNGFNGSIWSTLEQDIRSELNSTDTIYVVTGACYQTIGGNETVKQLTGANSSTYPQKLDIPNYYWKALLKVRRSGNTITDACAIGFWFEHKSYANNNYLANGIKVSVNFIESKTGFDLFANLPGDDNSGIEMLAEANTDWGAFQDF